MNSFENNLHLYEYSSIEMTQEMNGAHNQIYTDYNIGMRPNLVDRSHYQVEPGLKDKVSEKLKYILSN